jgi:hypothetical protein
VKAILRTDPEITAERIRLGSAAKRWVIARGAFK